MSTDAKPGTRVVCLSADGRSSYGYGTYLGDFARPGWLHPSMLAMCEKAITTTSGKDILPLASMEAFYDQQVADGKMTRAQADASLLRGRERARIENKLPLADRAWRLAAGAGLNPKIQLDSGAIVWGCECWWAEVDGAPPGKIRAIEQLPLISAPRQVRSSLSYGPDDLWMMTGHPQLEHLDVHGNTIMRTGPWHDRGAAEPVWHLPVRVDPHLGRRPTRYLDHAEPLYCRR